MSETHGFSSIAFEVGESGEISENGSNGREDLVFNPETGKLEVMNVSDVRLRPGREVVTAMNKRDGGGFFIRLTCA